MLIVSSPALQSVGEEGKNPRVREAQPSAVPARM